MAEWEIGPYEQRLGVAAGAAVPRFETVVGADGRPEVRECKPVTSTVAFTSGATRSSETLFDPAGFISPAVLISFSRYMEKHRVQADGSTRASDNWQKGMPTSRAIRSLTRHFFDLWLMCRGYKPNSSDCHTLEDALHAIMFNVQVILKNRIDLDDHEQDGLESTSAPRWRGEGK